MKMKIKDYMYFTVYFVLDLREYHFDRFFCTP